MTGLSPRVRGIPGIPGIGIPYPGSIPACTGNPLVYGRAPAAPRVYPRVYGESLWGAVLAWEGRGLSPRVRGIHRPAIDLQGHTGSIPACTGNPQSRSVNLVLHTVYPRVYGESDEVPPYSPDESGLSPRVRGIQSVVRSVYAHRGSIPACTGNPEPVFDRFWNPAVYPRVYGESLPALA